MAKSWANTTNEIYYKPSNQTIMFFVYTKLPRLLITDEFTLQIIKVNYWYILEYICLTYNSLKCAFIQQFKAAVQPVHMESGTHRENVKHKSMQGDHW